MNSATDDNGTIVWLHLSDLHTCKPKTGWDSRRVLQSLRDDLKQLRERHQLQPDLVFFTGDAAFGQVGTDFGQTLADQFKDAGLFFDDVRNCFTPAVARENLFLVPGNHDIDRTAVAQDQIDWLDRQRGLERITELIHSTPVQWRRYMERLAAYTQFLEEGGYNHMLTDQTRLLYSATREISGIKVGIAGLNSAWSCCRDREKGKLWLAGKWQLEHLAAELEAATFTIGLSHHPANWFVEHEEPDVWRVIERDFAFFLHGHEHRGWVEAKGDSHIRIASAACYDRSDRENGYNCVRLMLGTGEAEVWLRKYDLDGGGWIPRVVKDKTDNDGRWTLKVPFLQERARPRTFAGAKTGNSTAEKPRERITIVASRIEDVRRTTIALGEAVYNVEMRDPFRDRVRTAIRQQGGLEFGDRKDEILAAFGRQEDAVVCAANIQAAVFGRPITAEDRSREQWTVNVCVGIHTAEQPLSAIEGEEVVGQDVETARRMASLALRNQVIVSDSTYRRLDNRKDGRWYEWPNRCINGFEQCETIWELLWDNRGSHGVPGSAWIPPGHNPATSCYISRPREEEYVLSYYSQISRLVAVHGTCGTGKTRLALACGIRAASMFRDGVVYVRLGSKARSKKSVAQAIGIALGVAATTAQPDSLCGALRDKDLLIILDNYEFAACDEVDAYLHKLLSDATELRLLVAGRQAPACPECRVPLSLECGMTREEALALFYARLREVCGPRVLDPAAQHALERIIELADRNPRAIELAASWTSECSLQEIADYMEATPLPKARQDGEDVSDLSLRRSLDCSFELLEDWARDGFARLGVFADTFAAEAVSQICDADDAPRLLDCLCRAALVRRFEVNNQPRYGMHRSTHAYAKEKLDACTGSVGASIRRRFVQYFAQCSSRCKPLFRQRTAPPSEIRAALEWVEMEWENICSSVNRAFYIKESRIFVWLTRVVLAFLMKRGHWHDAEVLYDGLRQRCSSAPAAGADRKALGAILNLLGVTYQFEERWAHAEEAFMNCESLLKNDLDRAMTLNSLGAVYQAQEKWEKAKECHEESLRLCQAIKKDRDEEEEAMALSNLGLVYEHLGQSTKANEVLEASLRIWNKLCDLAGLAVVHSRLGRLHHDRGELQEAYQSYERSLTEFRRIGDLTSEAQTLNSIGSVCRQQGHHERAEEIHKAALRIYELMGDTVGRAVALGDLGETYKSQRRWKEAINAFESKAAMRRGVDRAKSLNSAGWVYEQINDVQRALDCYEDARKTSEDAGDQIEEAQSRKNIERVKKRQFPLATETADKVNL